VSEPGRCGWALGRSPLYVRYHDEEWGVPARDDRTQFEFLILESAQAGLSWETILKRREGYREAFAGFDPERVARFDEDRIEELLRNPAIIRNRAKVTASVGNARRFLEVQTEFGTFSRYIWGFVGDRPLDPARRADADVPAISEESDALARDMRRRGFRFVGITILYAHMQATGLVNDHVANCFRHAEIADASR